MQTTEHDWAALAELRQRFLGGGGATAQDYWSDARLCELYDATFAQRIAWKWRAVWGELARRGNLPAAARVLDWGCGTGIAAREFVAARGGAAGLTVQLFDRSRIARELAAKKLREQDARVILESELVAPGTELDLLLVSHVLSELDTAGREDVLALARRARSVVWVEPGEREVARALMRVRDELAAGRRVLGPCTHSASCGLNAAGRERDWCHSFAAPALEAFTSAEWREFSRRLKIDLRSAPYAYFALGEAGPVAEEPGAIRILGRPRLEKGLAKIDACAASGVRVLRVLERDAKAIVKQLADPTSLARTFRVSVDKDRVRSIE